MADTFTVTAYNVNTGVATVTFNFSGTTYTGLKVAGCPKTDVPSVKAFMLAHITAYAAGKAAEASAIAAIDPSVAALLNVATAFT